MCKIHIPINTTTAFYSQIKHNYFIYKSLIWWLDVKTPWNWLQLTYFISPPPYESQTFRIFDDALPSSLVGAFDLFFHGDPNNPIPFLHCKYLVRTTKTAYVSCLRISAHYCWHEHTTLYSPPPPLTITMFMTRSDLKKY